MNIQAHMSGQVPNQGGLTQQNGNLRQPSQMQSLGVAGGASSVCVLGRGPPSNMMNMDPDLMRTRDYMRGEVLKYLISRQQHPISEASMVKFQDFARRLDEALFKSARTKEDYTNLSTLEQKLLSLLRVTRNAHNQRHAQLVNSGSAPVGTMIPTPGMSHSNNPSIMATSSIDTSIGAANTSIAATNANTGCLLPTASMNSGSFGRPEGNLSNRHQQSAANFLVSSGGMSSTGVQRVASQMIPTPGFNSNNNNSISNQPNNVGGFSTVETTTKSQTQQQKQHGGQNSRILHTLGSQMGSGIRSGLQQKTFGFSNGSLNDSLGMMGNNMLIGNETGTSGGYQTTPPFANSPKPLLQQFDQHQRSLVQGDGYGVNNADSVGSGNMYGSATPVGSMTNSQNSDPVNLQSISRTNSSLISNPLNLHGAAHMKPQSMDRFEKMNFQPPVSSGDNILQANHLQQFQQKPLQFRKQQFQQQQLHTQQNLQHQNLLSNSGYNHSQMASDIGSQVKHVPRVECHDEVLHQQAPEQYQLPELQSQIQPNHAEEISSRQDMHSWLPQNSQQIQQMLHQQQPVSESQNDYKLSAGALPESTVQSKWQPHSQEQAQMPVNTSFEQHVQEDFQQRISGQGEAQCNNLSVDASSISPLVVPKSTSDLSNSKGAISKFGNGGHDRQFRNQVRWLLLLRHARRCKASEGKCDSNCFTVRELLSLMDLCESSQCSYPRCHHTKTLIRHHKGCRNPACPVCVPVNNYVQAQKARASLNSTSVLPSLDGISTKTHNGGDIKTATSTEFSTSVDMQPSLKRMKRDQSSQAVIAKSEGPLVSSSAVAETRISQDIHHQDHRYVDRRMPVKSEPMEMKMEVPNISAKGSPVITEVKNVLEDIYKQKANGEPITCDEFDGLRKQENAMIEKEPDSVKLENVTESSEGAAGTKSGKPNIKGVSLTELFAPEQVREHITGLRQWVGQSKAKAEKHQAMEHAMSENSCQLCAVERLTFEPPPIYCSLCGGRIKRNSQYYTVGAGDTRHYFCIPCHNDARGDSIVVDGTPIPKARLEKKKNDEETEEWWVQCDKCEAWQHQICALFNGRRNDGGQAEYTCPNCYIAEVEKGERKPLPQRLFWGPKICQEQSSVTT